LDVYQQLVDGPYPIRISNSQQLLDYKSIIARKLGINVKQIVLALNIYKGETKILEDNDAKIYDCDFIQYSKVFVAINNPNDPEFLTKIKKMAPKLDHLISLYFALPNMDSGEFDCLLNYFSKIIFNFQ
jgi:ubiquitin carboxyl-terminal hydrolase 47